MIESLSIRSLGVIDQATLTFGSGLTVLTGETGAGKTMVLTSLHLLLGGRADPAIVRHGNSAATVDGVLTIDEELQREVEELGAVVEDGALLVSRVVPANGRSRAQLGGRPLPAQSLQNIVGALVTVHGQTDQLRLREKNAQREALDSYGGAEHRELYTRYRAAWEQAVALKKRYDRCLDSREGRENEMAHLESALAAIEDLNPRVGEEEDLRAETQRLTNAEELRQLSDEILAYLTGDDDTNGGVDLVGRALDTLRSVARLDPTVTEMGTRLRDISLELSALRDDLAAYAETLEADPERLAALHARRAALRQLMEGRASDVEELLAWQDQARARLRELTSPDEDPALILEELHAQQELVREIGSELTRSREESARRLATGVTEELHALSMADASFIIELETHKPGPHGCEDVLMFLQPHPSAPARPLGQGASGGELSRVMLALEVMLGETEGTDTFIFDEVDAGIGGRTATEVGARLARLARTRQVVVVTHLAQVAACADHHLVVRKDDGLTTVHSVEGEERIDELTRMMGGDPHSEAARRHAYEMLAENMPQSGA